MFSFFWKFCCVILSLGNYLTGGKHKVFQPCPKQALVFMCLQYKCFENTVGKGEIACNKKFLLFPQCFLHFWRTFCHFHRSFRLLPANSFSLEESEFCRLGKG